MLFPSASKTLMVVLVLLPLEVVCQSDDSQALVGVTSPGPWPGAGLPFQRRRAPVGCGSCAKITKQDKCYHTMMIKDRYYGFNDDQCSCQNEGGGCSTKGHWWLCHNRTGHKAYINSACTKCHGTDGKHNTECVENINPIRKIYCSVCRMFAGSLLGLFGSGGFCEFLCDVFMTKKHIGPQCARACIQGIAALCSHDTFENCALAGCKFTKVCWYNIRPRATNLLAGPDGNETQDTNIGDPVFMQNMAEATCPSVRASNVSTVAVI